ncbi:MAG: aldose epimerase family protein [Pelobium sp.]
MKKNLITGISLLLAVAVSSCNNQQASDKSSDSMTVRIPDTANYNKMLDGKQVKLYTLTNQNQMKVAITNLGGRIVSIIVPNKDGKMVDVALGYDKVESYQKQGEPFFGAIIGRYGNRIGKGKFALDGKEYALELNDGVNTLHGGKSGFYNKVWEATQPNDSTLMLSYNSPDGEGGYPGNVKVNVTYTITSTNGIKMDYDAQSDEKTVLNLTNHAYFNLSGEGDSTILDHVLMVDADAITPVDNTLIPTGEMMDVSLTPFDFRKPTAIGDRINEENEQLKSGKGYDHNFVLNKKGGMQKVATVYSPKTGIELAIITEEPGLQFYSGNFLTGADKDGKGGKAYPLRSAFCLETQHFPDSPNKPNFPSTVLNAGDTYHTTTIYQFSTKK